MFITSLNPQKIFTNKSSSPDAFQRYSEKHDTVLSAFSPYNKCIHTYILYLNFQNDRCTKAYSFSAKSLLSMQPYTGGNITDSKLSQRLCQSSLSTIRNSLATKTWAFSSQPSNKCKTQCDSHTMLTGSRVQKQ